MYFNKIIVVIKVITKLIMYKSNCVILRFDKGLTFFG